MVLMMYVLCLEGVFSGFSEYLADYLQLFWILSGTARVSWYQKDKTRKVKLIWIYWSKRQRVAVASAGPYANLT